MNLKYKTLMFVTLFIFCIGSVCATDPDDNVDSDSKTKEVSIDKFKVGKELSQKMVNKVRELDKTVSNQAIRIQKLEESDKQKDIRIQNLETQNKELFEKLNDRDLEIKKLHDEKDKLNDEIKQTYEKLLNAPKIEDFNQLKEQIADKNNQIKQLKAKIETLNNIFSVSKNDVRNSLKGLSYVEKIQCGKYIFEHDDYLKIPLIKDGKKRIMEYKIKHGKLPNFVTIADYELSQEKYKKLYNM